MKREGRQHGMVRSKVVLPVELNARPKAKVVNCLNSPPTAGELTKVSRKPTNHSKYTGKCRKARCRECHAGPVSKAKDKTKGSYKLKSSDVTLNHHLVSCKAVDGGSILSFKESSASEILSHLSDSVFSEENDRYDDPGKENSVENESYDAYVGKEIHELIVEIVDDKEDEDAATSQEDSDENSNMEFDVVGMAMEYSDAEDWFVV